MKFMCIKEPKHIYPTESKFFVGAIYKIPDMNDLFDDAKAVILTEPKLVIIDRDEFFMCFIQCE